MTDNEYIRATVELADGFSWEWTQPRKELLIRFGTVAVNMTNTVYSPWMLDALAAQLVRQVDATDYEIRMQSCATTVFYVGDEFWQVGGKGRTMNTIKAIVDSEVLK